MADAPPLLALHEVTRRYTLPRERLLGPAPVVEALRGVSLALHAGRSFVNEHLSPPKHPGVGLKVRRANAVGDRIFIEGNAAAAVETALRAVGMEVVQTRTGHPPKNRPEVL